MKNHLRLSLITGALILGSTLALVAQTPPAAEAEGSILVDRKDLAKTTQSMAQLQGAAPVLQAIGNDVEQLKIAITDNDLPKMRSLAASLQQREALEALITWREQSTSRLRQIDTLLRSTQVAKPKAGGGAAGHNTPEPGAARGLDPTGQRWLDREQQLQRYREAQQDYLFNNFGVISELENGKSNLTPAMIEQLRKRSFALRLNLERIAGDISLLSQLENIIVERELSQGASNDPEALLEQAFKALNE